MWLKLDTNFFTNPKIWDLANKLEISLDEARMLLLKFWVAVLQHKEDGDITDWTDSQIAYMCEWKKSPDILKNNLTQGFIDDINGRLLVHDWLLYAGQYLTGKYHSRHKDKLNTIWQKYGKSYKQMHEIEDNPPAFNKAGEMEASNEYRLASEYTRIVTPLPNLPKQKEHFALLLKDGVPPSVIMQKICDTAFEPNNRHPIWDFCKAIKEWWYNNRQTINQQEAKKKEYKCLICKDSRVDNTKDKIRQNIAGKDFWIYPPCLKCQKE